MQENQEEYVKIVENNIQFSECDDFHKVFADVKPAECLTLDQTPTTEDEKIEWLRSVIDYRSMLADEVSKDWHYGDQDSNALVRFIVGGLHLDNIPVIHKNEQPKYYEFIIDYCEALINSEKNQRVDYDSTKIVEIKDVFSRDINPKAIKRSILKQLSRQSKQVNDDVKCELMKLVFSKHKMSFLSNIITELYMVMVKSKTSSWLSLW